MRACLQYKLTTVHWSVAGQLQFIASADEKGHVITWNIHTGNMSSYQPLSSDVHVFCLTFSPTTEHILAVGWVIQTTCEFLIDFLEVHFWLKVLPLDMLYNISSIFFVFEKYFSITNKYGMSYHDRRQLPTIRWMSVCCICSRNFYLCHICV